MLDGEIGILLDGQTKRLEIMCLAIPGRVETLFDDQSISMGKVNFGGVVKEICLAYLPDVSVGDYVIVHAGFALSRIDEDAAQSSLQTFEALGILSSEPESPDP